MNRFPLWFLLGLSLIGAIVSCSAIPAEPTPVPDGIWIDPDQTLTEISPLVYGTNYGPWHGITIENMEAFEASGITFLRFPGGRWGDENTIRSYHVQQLKTNLEMLDADVTVSARMLDSSPEEAAELVRMVNEELGRNVKYWSVGNEPSLYLTFQQEEDWDTVYYNEQWGLYADAIEAVDPDIWLLGPNTHQFQADEAANPKDANGLDWMREFLRVHGDRIDVVTFHRYPFPISRTDPIPEPDMLRDNSQEWDEIIPTLRALIQEETGRDIPIGVMEVNSNWSSVAGFETTPDSHLNAIWWGDALMRMIQQDVFMVTHFALQHNNSGWGIFSRVEVRPTYHVYQLYQRMGETKVASGANAPYVNVLAAERAEDGALTVLLVNLADDPITQPLSIGGETAVTADEVWTFAPESIPENSGSRDFDGAITLPGQSMTLLVIR